MSLQQIATELSEVITRLEGIHTSINKEIEDGKNKDLLIQRVEVLSEKLGKIFALADGAHSKLDPLQMLTIGEVAAKFGTSDKTLKPWIESGILKATYFGRNQMFSRHSVARFQILTEGLDLRSKEDLMFVLAKESTYGH